MAELAGKFAGIVVVSVPAEHEDRTQRGPAVAGWPAHGVCPPGLAKAGAPAADQQWTIDLLGNDRPGIVHEVSSVLHRHHLSIDMIETNTREAPMAGGQLFEAHVVVSPSEGADLQAMRGDLEQLASELLVDIALSPGQSV